ncbi:MAG: tetratricopeptide repeat protein [Candidatus Zixiibacteriota bacterium]
MRKFQISILIIILLLMAGCGAKMIVIKTKPVESNTQQVVVASQANATASDNHLLQAKKFYNAGKYKQAMKHCEKAVEFNHRNWEAHYYWGLAMQKEREYTVAINTLGVCLKYCPDNKYVKSDIHYAIGVSWEELGHLENASQEYALALELNPNNKSATKGKHRVKIDRTMENWKKKKHGDYDG